MKHSVHVVVAVCAALILTGCTTTDDIDATQLTIVTTTSSLDHATALAVAAYVTDHDIAVDIEQHDEPDDVFATLHAETAADHARVGVVTAQQDATQQDSPLRVPESVELLGQAPAELGLVPAASTVTAVRFAHHQQEQAGQPLAAACEPQTWLHAHTPDHEMHTTAAALAELGCEPEFEDVDTSDAAAHAAMAERLVVEDDTVALLYGVDPVIIDQGFSTLDVVTDQWPHSNMVAVAEPELEDPLVEHITAVLDVLDSDAATDLLRGYHNAQASSSDLNYSVDDATRFWLATQGLIDGDTVSEISTDNE